MSTVKIIEVIAESDKSWEDAANSAVAEACKTLHGVRSIWVKDMNCKVENGKITSWCLTCKLSFVLENAGNGALKAEEAHKEVEAVG